MTQNFNFIKVRFQASMLQIIQKTIEILFTMMFENK